MDEDGPAAYGVHEHAQARADAPVWRARLALGVSGGPSHQPRARRRSDGSAQPVAGAVPARVGDGPDRERAERAGVQRDALAATSAGPRVGAEAHAGVTFAAWR